MGVNKADGRPLLGVGGFAEKVESVTLSTAMKTLTNEGVSFVTYATSGKASDAVIPNPSYPGVRKTVILDNQTTSLEANFNLATTASVIWGTTFNTITVASTANDSPAFTLIARTTGSWALESWTANASTGATSVDWSLSATTGSTGQS